MMISKGVMYLFSVVSLLTVAFFATPVWSAADAWQSCSNGFEGGTEDPSPMMGSGFFRGGKKQICYDTNGTADSALLKANQCDNVDFKLFNMTDGDTSTMSVTVRNCPDHKDQDVAAGVQSTSTTTCEPILTDLATATNQEALGYKPGQFFIDWTTNTGSDAGRVEATCNGG